MKNEGLSDFYSEVAGEMQVSFRGNWTGARSGPDSSREYWRVVRPPVPVDMLINSGCEFWQKCSKYKLTEKLLSVDKCFTAYSTNIASFMYCQPRMNYWFSRFNFYFKLMCDLRAAGFVVEEGSTGSRLVETFAGFRITGLAEGRCWPWEQTK